MIGRPLAPRSEAPGWPAVVVPAAAVASDVPELTLRGLSRRDEAGWFEVRAANAEHLRPWDPTPPNRVGVRQTFTAYVKNLNREAAAGRCLPFAVEYADALVGQVHIFGIARASELSGNAGYWIAREVGGRGFATWALALAIDHAFGAAGLHRVEVNVRPENAASLAVVRRLGLREEGFKERYLHIDGGWRDHRSFAITVEELDGGLIQERIRCAP